MSNFLDILSGVTNIFGKGILVIVNYVNLGMFSLIPISAKSSKTAQDEAKEKSK